MILVIFYKWEDAKIWVHIFFLFFWDSCDYLRELFFQNTECLILFFVWIIRELGFILIGKIIIWINLSLMEKYLSVSLFQVNIYQSIAIM